MLAQLYTFLRTQRGDGANEKKEREIGACLL